MNKLLFINQLPDFSIDGFLKERIGIIKEINSKILEPKKNTHRFFQAIPRTLRRRAASHNPRRVPSRFRGSSKSSKKTGQSHICDKSRKNGWSPYHIWFSKRFKMAKYYGVSIPFISKEKTFRKTYYAAKFRSILFDLSYFKKIKINRSLF